MAFLRIAQDLVGLVDLFEFILGRLAPGISIRVEFEGKLAVGFL